MRENKICVYALAKNEEKHVERFMDSVAEADKVIIADTGSEDRTIEAFRDRGAKVIPIEVNPWRFDVARNNSIALLPTSEYISLCLDPDEVISEGWSEKIKKAWKNDTKLNSIQLKYITSTDEAGNPSISYWQEKGHSRYHFNWIYPVHEVLAYIGPCHVCYKTTKLDITVKHLPDENKQRNYLDLLELGVQERPNSSRCTFYLAREYMYQRRNMKAINEFERYLNLPFSTWLPERSAAMIYISYCYQQLEQPREQEKWLLKAQAELPDDKTAFVKLAEFYYFQDRWEECLGQSVRAMRVTGSDDYDYIKTEYAWREGPYDLASIAAWNLGMKNSSLLYALEALKRAPNKPRIISNVLFFKNQLEEQNG